MSVEKFLYLIQNIIGTDNEPGLTPHRVRDTLSVNEARRLINILSQPLGDIMENIEDNIRLIGKHEEEIKMIGNDLMALKKKLFIPVCEMQIIELANPMTVCVSEKCRHVVDINGIQKYDFPKKCHDNCTVYGSQREIVGDERMRKCRIFKWYTGFNCCKCKCSYKQHKHIYSDTKLNVRNEIDSHIKKQLDEITDAEILKKKMIERLVIKSEDLEGEQRLIIQCQAKFAKFVQENSIAPLSDVFKVYIE